MESCIGKHDFSPHVLAVACNNLPTTSANLGRRLWDHRPEAAVGVLPDEAGAPAPGRCRDIRLVLDDLHQEDVLRCATQLWHGHHVIFVDTAWDEQVIFIYLDVIWMCCYDCYFQLGSCRKRIGLQALKELGRPRCTLAAESIWANAELTPRPNWNIKQKKTR